MRKKKRDKEAEKKRRGERKSRRGEKEEMKTYRIK